MSSACCWPLCCSRSPSAAWATSGRSFLADLAQADPANLGSALLGGVIFNAANILLVAAIAMSGMAVAFPVGIGLALVLGVVVNYMAEPAGNPLVLCLGVAFIAAAILLTRWRTPDCPGKQTRVAERDWRWRSFAAS